MRALTSLTVANARSFVRDRAAIFWTLAFPILFVLLFGSIYDSLAQMRRGDADGVVVVPAGVGDAIAAAGTGGTSGPVALRLYTDPSQQQQSATLQQIVAQVVS